MPKRKRSLEDELEERLAKCRKDLFRVLKVAKGFERQRLAKRVRDDKSTPEKIARLDREIIVLKSLDLQQAANAHLCASLLKIKGVAESPKLPDEVKNGVSKPDISEEERPALHNVTSALYNRSQVKEVLERSVTEICGLLRVPVPDKKGKGKKGEKHDSITKPLGDEKPSKKTLPSEPKPQQQVEEREGSWSGGEEEVFEGFDDMDDADEDEGDGSGSEKDGQADEDDSGDISSGKEEEAVSRWEAMLGSGSSDSEEEEDRDVEDEEDEDDDGQSAVSDDTSKGTSSPRKVARARKATKPLGADSLFLPSLMGGYISGSESASDVDVAPPARKNRRGQRARQAIWDKKYKEKAKHHEKEKIGRDAGWDTKRGAVGGGDNNRPWKSGIHNPFDRNRAGGDGASDKPKRAALPPKKDNEGPLHPSWEAKRKAKEMQKTAAFQGKKITFD